MSWAWATSTANTGTDTLNRIALDQSGNAYVTGTFTGTAQFGTYTLTSDMGSNDIFVAKYDSTGAVLWAQSAGGAGYDAGNGIAVDSFGNSCVTGTFEGTAQFGTYTLTASGGSNDIFVAKYDSAGAVLWAQSAGGAGYDQGYGIALDSSGNAFVTGFFEGTAQFGTFTLTSSGATDIFIAKYDPSGVVLWAERAGGPGIDVSYGISVDASNNAYITGRFQGTAQFGTFTLTASGSFDIFVAKYDSAGTVLWAQSAGGSSADLGFGIAVDPAGNAYVTGFFRGTAQFGTFTLTSSGSDDIFVTKYSSAGTVLWAEKAGGTGLDQGFGIAVDPAGNAYVTGAFQGTAQFGTFTLTSSGALDIFVAKYNSGGAVQWAEKAGGGGSDQGYGIALDSACNAYITGTVSTGATFGSSITLANTGVFVAKLLNPDVCPCVAESTLVSVVDARGAVPICELVPGDQLIDARGRHVELVRNVRLPGTSRRFVQLSTGSLGAEQPSSSLLIRAGHALLAGGLEVLPEALAGTQAGVEEIELSSGVAVHTLCTRERSFVLMQGVPVSTWSSAAWAEYSSSAVGCHWVIQK